MLFSIAKPQQLERKTKMMGGFGRQRGFVTSCLLPLLIANGGQRRCVVCTELFYKIRVYSHSGEAKLLFPVKFKLVSKLKYCLL